MGLNASAAARGDGEGAVPVPVDARRSSSIDALRAVAALAVVGFHALLLAATGPGGGLGHAVATNLDAGVELFFVISGLLIAGPFVRALVDGGPLPVTRAYALRRASRILPAYWVALVVVAGTGVGAAWWQWGLYATLLQNPVPGQIEAILPVAWTLHVEAVFYILVPVVAVVASRRLAGRTVPVRTAALTVAAVWLASAVFEAASGLVRSSDWSRVAVDSVPATLGLFCPGILLALATSEAARGAGAWRRWRSLAGSSRAMGVTAASAAVLGIGMAQSGWGPVVELRRQAFAVAAVALLALVLEGGPRLRRVLRPLAPLGVISYSIYLLHWSVLRELGRHGVHPSAGLATYPLRAAVLGAVTVVCAAVCYLLVERPAMQWAAGRTRRPAGVAPAVLVPLPATAD